MADHEHAFTYHLLRYTPNLMRDEFFNVGVVLRDATTPRLELRLVESDAEFARLRRIHPDADLDVVRGLERELQEQLSRFEGGTEAWLERMDQTLSGVLQFSPQRAVLSRDFDAELDRLYHDHVEPARGKPGREALHSRVGIRARANDVFRRAGILNRLERNIRVEEFTFPGDPMRVDYAYRRNGTRGFVHTVALERDPAQAKALVFTHERVREKSANVEFTAVTETKPVTDNPRHRFVAELFTSEDIQLVPLPALEGWARELGARIQ